MVLDDKVVIKILETTGDARTLGYYVALKVFGLKTPIDMSKMVGMTVNQCRLIEKRLVDMGLLVVSGVGRNRLISFPEEENKEAIALLEFFAKEIGREIITYTEWYRRQSSIAADLVDEFGYDASRWMVHYILSVKKIDMYSLNLVKSMACELMPKYKRFIKGRQKIQEQNVAWDNLDVAEYDEDIPDEEVDMGQLLNFGIDL